MLLLRQADDGYIFETSRRKSDISIVDTLCMEWHMFWLDMVSDRRYAKKIMLRRFTHGITGWFDKKLEWLDLNLNSNRFLNTSIGIITLLLVFLFWIMVNLKEGALVRDILSNLEYSRTFGDALVPSAITFWLGVFVQNVTLLGKQRLRHYSGLIVIVICVITQIIFYAVFRKAGDLVWVVISSIILPIVFSMVVIMTCDEDVQETNISSISG